MSTRTITRATTPSDFNSIFSLNHKVFAEELGQHPTNAARILVDAYHEQNSYFIVKNGSNAIGMICLTHPIRGRKMAIEAKLSDVDADFLFREKAVEIRLLAILKEYRDSSIIFSLIEVAMNFAISSGYRNTVVSAMLPIDSLYGNMGFKAFDRVKQIGLLHFQPMICSLDAFKAGTLNQQPYLKSASHDDQPTDIIASFDLRPGPLPVTSAVQAGLTSTAFVHPRSAPFHKLLRDSIEQLRVTLDIPETMRIAIIATSGTGACEAMLQGFLRRGIDNVFVIRNGHFGERLYHLCHNLGLTTSSVVLGDGVFDIATVRDAIIAAKGCQAVVMTHLETSIGQLNPVRDVAQVCHAHNLLLGVDAVSSLGGDNPILAELTHADCVVSVSGKALASFPGLAIGIQSRQLASIPLRRPPLSRALDIDLHFEAQNERGEFPHTPPVPLIKPLLIALGEHHNRDNRVRQHLNQLFWQEFVRYLPKGFAALLCAHPSHYVRTFSYPKRSAAVFAEWRAQLEREHIYIYQNESYHQPRQHFQVSLFSCMRMPMLSDVLAAFSRVAESRYRIEAELSGRVIGRSGIGGKSMEKHNGFHEHHDYSGSGGEASKPHPRT